MLDGKEQENYIRVLANSKPEVQKAILNTASSDLIKALCNCCSHGIYNPSVLFSPSERTKLRQYQDVILKLAHPKVTLQEKKKLIKKSVDFLSILLPKVLKAVPFKNEENGGHYRK